MSITFFLSIMLIGLYWNQHRTIKSESCVGNPFKYVEVFFYLNVQASN
jgi:hypothetical protein